MKVRKEFAVTIPVQAQLRDKHGMTMVPLSKVGFFVVLALVIITICLAFFGSDLKALFFYSPGQLAGEWVGTAHLTASQKNMFADVQPLAKRGAIHLDLHVYDRSLHRFRGTGELLVEGNNTPHRFQVVDLSADSKESSHVTGSIVGEKELSETVSGTIQNGELHLRFTSDLTVPGYEFTAILSRGNQADYTRLKEQLSQVTTHGSKAE